MEEVFNSSKVHTAVTCPSKMRHNARTTAMRKLKRDIKPTAGGPVRAISRIVAVSYSEIRGALSVFLANQVLIHGSW
jgi:hypothetical protein